MPLQPEAAPTPPFNRAAEAWATEVLRRRRLPPTSPAWRSAAPVTAAQRENMAAESASINLSAETAHVAEVWRAPYHAALPQGAAERYALAQKIQATVLALPPEDAKILQAWAWGDWADEARLRGALALQEKARRNGLRVRLSYRYSTLQLGQMLGCSKAQAWRKLRMALQHLELALQRAGVVEQPLSAAQHPKNTSPRPVRHAAFKN